ncbi:hypothetical protein QMK61_06145 [Fulvimonas sp. R45]|uniref:PepSY domain-containing protein n=1 Tax=Fulvimonas sp. R45 TaxID=3045937 RepID=UPI00265FD28A|nr:hypothetical protein [Fulvimonas sp. R45]MDO1528414.1 hypothetical protein [Fulvimonas sp. R45]
MALRFPRAAAHGAPYILAGLLAGLPLAALATAQQPSAASLDEAVIQVQQQTGGRVLSAEQRHVGRRLEYRIKVLTPEGHVKVVAVSADTAHAPSAASSTKNPAGNGAGNKEKH